MKPLLIIFPLLLLLFASCEEDIEIELPNPEEKLAVEATIESGNFPVVIVTRSANLYSSFDLDNLAKYIVTGADVTISDGSRTVQLQEVTIDTVNGVKLVVYVAFDMIGEEGRTYSLTVRKDANFITATATIPVAVPLDSVYYEHYNWLDAKLRGHLSDPAGIANYYRYSTSTNGRNFAYWYDSVMDDILVDGHSFPFPIYRGVDSSNESLEGLFRTGDTVTVRWCSISRETFNFYRSIEYQRQNTGNPFSNITRIESNVKGGLGVFAANSCTDYNIVIKRR